MGIIGRTFGWALIRSIILVLSISAICGGVGDLISFLSEVGMCSHIAVILSVYT